MLFWIHQYRPLQLKHLFLENLGVRLCNCRFRCVLALVGQGLEETFAGTCEGVLLPVRRGSGGFGYDPLFLPNESASTFAEISLDEKAKISHRARALTKLIDWLKFQWLSDRNTSINNQHFHWQVIQILIRFWLPNICHEILLFKIRFCMGVRISLFALLFIRARPENSRTFPSRIFWFSF